MSGAQSNSSTEAAASNSTTQADAQGLLDYAETITNTGDELMFTMDVPNVPVQDTPIVLVQAAASGNGTTTPTQPDYILKECQETTSIGDPGTAFRGVDPAYMLTNFLNSQSNKQVVFDLASVKNIALLEGTKHGKIFAEVDNEGLTSYHYDPIPGYTGNDQAIFMADFDGKTYKIVVNLKVAAVEAIGDPTICPPPQLIKVNGKPVSGSLN